MLANCKGLQCVCFFVVVLDLKVFGKQSRKGRFKTIWAGDAPPDLGALRKKGRLLLACCRLGCDDGQEVALFDLAQISV